MNLINRRLLSISNADALCFCGLLAHTAVWFKVLASQNGFMKQNECKHSQLCLKLCLKGLNGQDKPHYFLYFKRNV